MSPWENNSFTSATPGGGGGGGGFNINHTVHLVVSVVRAYSLAEGESSEIYIMLYIRTIMEHNTSVQGPRTLVD